MTQLTCSENSTFWIGNVPTLQLLIQLHSQLPSADQFYNNELYKIGVPSLISSENLVDNSVKYIIFQCCQTNHGKIWQYRGPIAII